MLEADARTTLRFASALSTHADSEAAVTEVLAQLGGRLSAAADLLVVFATMHHGSALQGICGRLRDRLGGTVIGCTCEGVIGVRREVQEGPGLSVLAGSLPGATLTPFRHDQIDIPAMVDAPAALRASIMGEAAVDEASQGGGETPGGSAESDPRAIVLLADPFSTPMVNLLPAFTAAFPSVPVIGGMASGGRQARKNRLVIDDTLLRDGAVGVAIGGDVDVHTTVSQGCRPIGRPFVITRAKRHILQELGGRNALEAIQAMASDLDTHDQRLLQTNGIFVGRVINEYQERFGRGDFLVRNVIGVDPDEGYIAINDPRVRVGQTVQFHVRDQQAATEDFELLLEAQRLHGPGSGALLFSCNSRGTRLFDRPDADAAMVGDAMGDLPMAGFFAAGEIGPIGDENFIHGHTASLAVFRGRAEPQMNPDEPG